MASSLCLTVCAVSTDAGVNCEINFDDCASNPCEYGMCEDGINRYDCVCKPGFTGEDLSGHVEPQTSHITQTLWAFLGPKGMISLKLLLNLSFFPVLSFPGPKCNVEIDECSSNPCRNGGTCVDEENGFHCQCPEGFHEPYCYSKVDECASNPCVNGACREDPNG